MSVLFMQLKRDRMPTSQLGVVIREFAGWRVAATVEHRRIYGPMRSSEREAFADIEQARAADTYEEYREILRLLYDIHWVDDAEQHPE